MTNAETISKNLELFIEELKQTLTSESFTDTGKARDSLHIVATNYSYQVLGKEYLEFLNRGSRPWSDQSSKSVRKLGFILQKSGWAERRGVNPYAVANVIVKKGSQVYRKKRTGIQLENLISDLRKNITKEVSKNAKFEIIEGLNKFTKSYKSA